MTNIRIKPIGHRRHNYYTKKAREEKKTDKVALPDYSLALKEYNSRGLCLQNIFLLLEDDEDEKQKFIQG